jgi:hypothetical protein
VISNTTTTRPRDCTEASFRDLCELGRCDVTNVSGPMGNGERARWVLERVKALVEAYPDGIPADSFMLAQWLFDALGELSAVTVSSTEQEVTIKVQQDRIMQLETEVRALQSRYDDWREVANVRTRRIAELEELMARNEPFSAVSTIGGNPRRFLLVRDEDVTGISGVGVVAAGIMFPPTRVALDNAATTGQAPERHVALEWLTEWPTSVVFHERGLESLEHVHGHEGRTRIEWLDGEPDTTSEANGEASSGAT